MYSEQEKIIITNIIIDAGRLETEDGDYVVITHGNQNIAVGNPRPLTNEDWQYVADGVVKKLARHDFFYKHTSLGKFGFRLGRI